MLKNFKKSLGNIKKLNVLCAMALLTALYVALYSLKVPLSNELRITFTFIPIALAGWIFGIAPAIIVGAIGDILGCMIFPSGAYFPGYTLTAMLTGLVFGVFLYGKNDKNIILPIIISRALVTVFLNIGLNSYWASFFVDKAVYAIMIGKITKNLIMFPVEIVVLYCVIMALYKAGIQKMYK